MANNEPAKTNKRRLKAPTQTMRQQAEKAQANSDKPDKTRRLRSAANTGSQPFRRFGKLFDRQPFRFIGRILAPRFVRNAIIELRLVTWPSRRETRQLTFAIAFGVIVTIVDYGLDKLFKALIID